MLKALKTLLKDDIMNQNTWRIKYMGTERYELKDVHILMWLAVLNNYKDPDYCNDTFDDKMHRFIYLTADIKEEDLNILLEKMRNDNFIDLSTGKHVLTLKGKALMKALGTMYKVPDEKVRDTIEITKGIYDFVKKQLSSIILKIVAAKG